MLATLLQRPAAVPQNCSRARANHALLAQYNEVQSLNKQPITSADRTLPIHILTNISKPSALQLNRKRQHEQNA